MYLPNMYFHPQRGWIVISSDKKNHLESKPMEEAITEKLEELTFEDPKVVSSAAMKKLPSLLSKTKKIMNKEER